MQDWLMNYLCDPVDKSPLRLSSAVRDKHGGITSGQLLGGGGRSYPIINGIPRFVERSVQASVDAFGDQWNYFNYDDFYIQWKEQTLPNGLGGEANIKDKTILDCGAGHGMQSRWMVEHGARRVIALELSHCIDGVAKKNLKNMEDRVALVQCSIDQPPIKDGSIGEDGIVLCHNVIQHTPNVEKTAHALWRLVGKGGQFIFNCYTRDDSTLPQRLRFKWHSGIRWVLSHSPHTIRLWYCYLMATLRLVPGLGWLLEKSMMMGRGIVIPGPRYIQRAWWAAVQITYDGFGGHTYQHHLSFGEQRALALELQPNQTQWENTNIYFSRPMPISAALVLNKS